MPHFLMPIAIAVVGLLALFVTPVVAEGTSDGSSTEAATDDVYAEVKAMVDSGNYVAALPILITLTKTEARNADAWNLLGFTLRMLGQIDDSATAYLSVLSINPNHLGALEYQGELFLATGQPDLAKANLARLQGLCGSCAEYEDLAQAIQAAGV